ncbi:MAG: cardiolipin synthase B [Proteobacteria bacterium]|nr:cardiolipin synthase B [Pseudomonadota bacterium]
MTRPLACLVVCCLLLAACAVPDADRAIQQAPAQPTQIEAARGPLSVAESRRLLARIGGSRPEDILRRHLAIEEAVTGSPLTADNKVTVLHDGPETFRAIASTIKGAKRSLNLEYYAIEDVRLDVEGPHLRQLLIEKVRQGVAVNILYDGYGSSGTPPDFFATLEKAGVKLLAYHPLGPNPVDTLEINDRDHRKILVADGRVGIVGGVNLSKSYESKSPGSDRDEPIVKKAPMAPADPLANAEWRDTAIRIEGPAVLELQSLFRDHWRREKGPKIDETGFFPETSSKGHDVVRIIGSSPDDEIPRYYVTLISALRNAESRAWISAAYFVPTPEQEEALMAATARGVDVRLLLAGDSDSPPAIEAARARYADLLGAGIRIFETHGIVLHAKSATIDGVWSAVGSSNFDHRSVLYNDEVDAIVLGAKTARELETIFTEGMRIATEIDPATWEDTRGLPERMKGFFVGLWEQLL